MPLKNPLVFLAPGVWSRAWCSRDWDGPEGDDSSQEVLQDEQLLRRHPPLCLLQVERVSPVAARRFQVRISRIRMSILFSEFRRKIWFRFYKTKVKDNVFSQFAPRSHNRYSPNFHRFNALDIPLILLGSLGSIQPGQPYASRAFSHTISTATLPLGEEKQL